MTIAADTLIFDLDNTLIDRNQAMWLTISDWLKGEGYAAEKIQAAMNDILLHDDWGYKDRISFSNWLLQMPDLGNERKFSDKQLVNYLFDNIGQHVHPDAAVNAALQAVANQFTLVLASNGNSTTQRTKLKQAQLETFFSPQAIFISGEMGVEKPAPEFFEQIIDTLQLDRRRAMYIGDNPVNDVGAAAACGLQTCWVSHGRNIKDGLVADIVITTITGISVWSKG